MAALDAVLTTIDANLDASRERLFDLLRIPSVSTDPAYSAQCLRAANWLKDQLNGLGYEAQVRETPGHPIVVGHAKAKRKDAPHVLFYGHYDVQPPIRWNCGKPSPSRRALPKARTARTSSPAAPRTTKAS